MGEPGLPVPPLSGRPEVTLLSKLLHGVAERLHAEFAMLMQGLATQPDPER